MLTGRLFGGTPRTERPLISISPEVGSRNPATIRISVVLPQPDGPRIEKNDPEGTEKLTSSTAKKVPNARLTSRHSRSMSPEGPAVLIIRYLPGKALDTTRPVNGLAVWRY